MGIFGDGREFVRMRKPKEFQATDIGFVETQDMGHPPILELCLVSFEQRGLIINARGGFTVQHGHIVDTLRMVTFLILARSPVVRPVEGTHLRIRH